MRGAPNDQLLVLLDGLELWEPFHLKDIEGGVFSIIDVEAVSDVELVTGGFSAEHGGRMGGVFSMGTTTPTRAVTTLGASLQNVTLRSQGAFADGRGAWLAGARRGFLDLVLALMNEEESMSPTYYDVFAKAQYQLGSRHLVSAHVLYAGDDLSADDQDAGSHIESRWSSAYAWLNWDAGLSSALSAQTVLSAGRVSRNRNGLGADSSGPSLDVRDRGTYEFIGVTQDWSLRVSSGWLAKWGFDLRRGRTSYDYRRWWREWVPNLTDPAGPAFTERDERDTIVTSPSGDKLGAYVAHRVRPVSALTAEVGLRFDYHSHTGSRTLAPRVNVALQVAPRTTLRGAWGFYYQAQDLPDLQVADLDARFYPAQRAEHRILGLEQRLVGGTTLRLEAYERRIVHPRPEFRSLVPFVELVPEVSPEDRVRVEPARGRARGVELLVRRDAGGSIAWSASYALAAAEDAIGGAWVPRPHDQRHALRAEFAYRPSPRWSITCAWQVHSGWPMTEQTLQLDTTATGVQFVRVVWGRLNSARLPAYHRLDARITRHFPLGGGRLSVFLDLFNAYNRHNAWAYALVPERIVGDEIISRREVEAVGLLPTLGVRWEF